jgi:glycerol-3-phosphate acyltransferase PlsY
MTRYFIAFFGAYLVGSVPTAYLFTRRLKGLDIREHGSGNVGATNASRVLGKKWGLVIFAIDFLKGCLPALAVTVFLGEADHEAGLTAWCAGGAVLGHIFTPFLGFRGGKGVATGGGVLFGLYPFLFLATFPAWFVVFGFTRIVSVASLAALLTLVGYSFLLEMGPLAQSFFVTFLFLITWTHRENLSRLRKGKENKL